MYFDQKVSLTGLLLQQYYVKKQLKVIFNIPKITFNCFLTYKAIQTRPPVLLVDSPYKSCIAPPSDPPRAC
jgi:hypothetical protein